MKATRRVQAFLKREKKDQRWLAAELGVSPAYVSMLLAGKRSPSLTIAGRLEDITGIPARAFAEAA